MKLLHVNLMRILYAVMLAMAVGLAGIAKAGDLRIAGTGNALGSMKLLAQAYNKSHSQTKVTVLESLGSSGGIRAVAKGAIEIAVSAKPLTASEKERGLIDIEYARSPTVLAVGTDSKIAAITTKQIEDIYRGKLKHWPDGTMIRPILRQPGEDNTRQIMALSPDMPAALDIAHNRPGMPFAVTDQDTAAKLENIPGSIGVTTLALILSEKRRLRPLMLDGIKPTPQNVQSGRYPMTKRFYFVVAKNHTQEIESFIKFVRSARGRTILKHSGHTLP